MCNNWSVGPPLCRSSSLSWLQCTHEARRRVSVHDHTQTSMGRPLVCKWGITFFGKTQSVGESDLAPCRDKEIEYAAQPKWKLTSYWRDVSLHPCSRLIYCFNKRFPTSLWCSFSKLGSIKWKIKLFLYKVGCRVVDKMLSRHIRRFSFLTPEELLTPRDCKLSYFHGIYWMYEYITMK